MDVSLRDSLSVMGLEPLDQLVVLEQDWTSWADRLGVSGIVHWGTVIVGYHTRTNTHL